MDVSTLTDIFIIAIVLLSAGVAFFRGFVQEVLTIAGTLGGLFAAYLFGDNFVPMMEGFLGVVDGAEEPKKLFNFIPYGLIAIALAYGAVFIFVVIVLSVLSHFLSKAITATGLGPVDRTLGVFFGVARALLFLGILYLPVHLLAQEEQKESWFGEAKLHVYVAWTSDWLAGFIPSEESEDADKARELLDKMDLLKNDENVNEDVSGSVDTDDSITEQNAPSYGLDPREAIENLIKEKVDTYNE